MIISPKHRFRRNILKALYIAKSNQIECNLLNLYENGILRVIAFYSFSFICKLYKNMSA